MVWSVKMRWFNSVVTVATGFATAMEAEGYCNSWKREWKCSGHPFYLAQEPSGEPESSVDLRAVNFDDVS